MMELKMVPTYTATIYIGLKHHYIGSEIGFGQVEDFIQKWVDENSMCVSVTRNNYIYKGGSENGLEIGFINYPRFPSSEEEIQKSALNLGLLLMKKCEQMRVSVVCPHKTYMFSNEEEIEKYLISTSHEKCNCIGNRKQYISGNLVYCDECKRPIWSVKDQYDCKW